MVLPFSTDQFAGAAAVVRSGFGVALDPNAATSDEIAEALRRALDLGGDARAGLDAVAAGQAARPGPELAFEALTTRASATSAAIAPGSRAAAR